MSDVAADIRARARERGLPSLAEAVSATGGVAVALGVLLITIDIRADNSGRAPGIALFGALILAGYLVLAFLPPATHAAGVSAVAIGIPGALGWALLPGAHRIADVRPFLVLTILGWVAAFVLPRTRGRTIFIAAAAVLLWLWILGEVAGTDSYSAAPIPSPPAHTVFSLQSFAGARSAVALTDLDPSDPLYSLAVACDNGDGFACDALSRQAPAGSDFQDFGATCGNTRPDHAQGACDIATGNGLGVSPSPFPTPFSPISPITGSTNDKALEIGLVSALFGVLYLGALFVFDRARWRGLATAFVVPGSVALITGAQSLGNAAHHAWASGLFTIVAGLAIGIVGDRTVRRFTTWAGGVTVALGGLTIALDVSHISRSISDGSVKLAGPGFIVIGLGAGLVATGLVIAHLLGGEPRDPTEPTLGSPTPVTEPPSQSSEWGSPEPSPSESPPPSDPPPASPLPQP